MSGRGRLFLSDLRQRLDHTAGGGGVKAGPSAQLFFAATKTR